MASVAAQPAVHHPRYVADIQLQTESELSDLLGRAEQLLIDGKVGVSETAPVTLVLHGPVLRTLMRPNYLSSKTLVDQAASLSALGVLEIKACRTWMGANEEDETQLQPFVDVVPYGVGEVDRLIKEQGYIEF